MTTKSSSKNGAKLIDRPKPPVPDAPLCAANNGYWQKKIGGKIHYFGRWGRVVSGNMQRLPGNGWTEALAAYKAAADTGFTEMPGKKGDELTVGHLCNHFRTAMLKRLNANRKMSAGMYNEYVATTDRLTKVFKSHRKVSTLKASDFAALRDSLEKDKYGYFRMCNEIQKVRTIFKYAYENELVDRQMRFGTEFKRPGKDERRKHRAKMGARMFEAAEIRALLAAAEPALKAMILLGVNSAFGNSDCASLPKSALDLQGGWVTFPRPKNGIERRCSLWPETVEALSMAIAKRPEPKDKADSDLVFLSKEGHRLVRPTGKKRAVVDMIYRKFDALCKRLKLDRTGVKFYALRHTFRTVADAAKDGPAIRRIMGHTDGSIDDVYREKIDDSRLKEVTDYVHDWLFGASSPSPEKEGDKA